MLQARCQSCGQVLPDSNRWWNVHKAVADGNEEYIRNAISEGVELEIRDPNTGDTPLSMAAFWGRENIANFLLARGADVNSQNLDGHTPIFWAIYRNHRNIVALLLDNGANIKLTTATGMTALHCAASYGDFGVLDIGSMDLLINAGADINARDGQGETPLHHAVRQLYEMRAKYLLDHGANMGVTNNDGDTPFEAAKKYGSKNMMKLLREHGAI